MCVINKLSNSEVHQLINSATLTNSLQVVGEFTEGIHVSSAIYYSPPMQRLVQAAVDITNWGNDIYSFRKVMLISKGLTNLWLFKCCKKYSIKNLSEYYCATGIARWRSESGVPGKQKGGVFV